MAKRVSGVVKYVLLFIIVFVIALVFFAIIFGEIFPTRSLAEGPISPYYAAKRAQTPETEASGLAKPEFSQLISVYERMSASEKMRLYTLFSSKLTEAEMNSLYEMAADGVTDAEREYFNSLAAERLTAEEIGELYAVYEKYA
ncbi:MAG: hypothetical protein IKZ81_01150 [Clostridia bacterium]|nr:hypothetical protein [Clostridia bacterium]